MASTVNVITLGNLHEAMPQWDPSGPSYLYALVDMGRCLYRERAAISLFDALHAPPSSTSPAASLTFPSEVIRRVSTTLARFRAIAIDDYDVPVHHITVFATEAMRRAQNAAAMLEAISAETGGLEVHVLAPEVETLFGSLGARSSFVDVRGLFLDLGGGSVQMTYMDTHHAGVRATGASDYAVVAAQAGQSLPFGAARLMRVLEDDSPEVQALEKAKLHSGMQQAFQRLKANFASLQQSTSGCGGGADVYLCGGGFRGYGYMLMHNEPVRSYPFPSIGTYTVPGSAFAQTKKMLEANRYEGKIFGMSKRRRAQFPAIVTVVEALIQAVPIIRSVTFCSGGNREGALMTMIPQELRESNPLATDSIPRPMGPLATDRGAVINTVVSTLREALPATSSTNVFSLGIERLLTERIWNGTGLDAASNASACLHDLVTSDPTSPGLTHLARAVLALTLNARWGGNPGPSDKELHDSLRRLVAGVDTDANFWAEYIGAVTAAVATIIPSWPKSASKVTESIRFGVAVNQHDEEADLHLRISVSSKAMRGLDPAVLKDLFKPLGKKKKGRRLTVQIQEAPYI